MCVPSAFVLHSSCDERLFRLLLLQFFRACGTDIAILKAYKPVRTAAEYTSAAEFMKNDIVAVYIYLKRILLRDVKSAAHLDWQHDSSQFINFAHDSCRFHCSSLPKFCCPDMMPTSKKPHTSAYLLTFYHFLSKNQWKHFVVCFRKHKQSLTKHSFICRHLSHSGKFSHYLDVFTNISIDIILYL